MTPDQATSIKAGISQNLERLRRAIENCGLIPPEKLIADGIIHYFKANNFFPLESGHYQIVGQEVMVCKFGDAQRNFEEFWYSHDMDALTPAQVEAFAVYAAKAEAATAHELKKTLSEERKLATQIFNQANAVKNHPFLESKCVVPFGLRTSCGTLLIPMRSADLEICGLQKITDQGISKFTLDNTSEGCYFSIGTLSEFLVICKDYISGASIHMATNWAVAVAFRVDNLEPVAKALRSKYPKQKIVVAAEDEFLSITNPGFVKAKKAAEGVGATCIAPKFRGNRPAHAASFNDMHCLYGLEAVRAQLFAAMGVQDAE